MARVSVEFQLCGSLIYALHFNDALQLTVCALINIALKLLLIYLILRSTCGHASFSKVTIRNVGLRGLRQPY